MRVHNRLIGTLLGASLLAVPFGANVRAAQAAPEIQLLSNHAASPTIVLVRGHKLRNTAIVVGGAMAAHHIHKKHQAKKAQKQQQKANQQNPQNANQQPSQQPAR